MTELPEPSAETPPIPPRRRKRSGWSLRITPGGVILLFLCNAILLGILAWPIMQKRLALPPTPAASQTPQPVTPLPSPSSTLLPSDTPLPSTHTPLPPPPFPISSSPLNSLPGEGTVILALDEGAYTHLFAYNPRQMPISRLTDGAWDDLTPAISPDGKRLAFASNRNGYWDIYLMDLTSGEITRLTDSLEYDAAPSWSPDGVWIAYESYTGDGGLDIFIRPVEGDQAPIRLTNHPGADYDPAWSPPPGRKIAFVSTRSGVPEVWLADLDKADAERFQNLSQNAAALEAHPAWSPDGTRIAWAAVRDGIHSLYLHKFSPEDPVAVSGPQQEYTGSGDWPVWSPDGETLLSALLAPNQTYLTAYHVAAPELVMPPFELPGDLEGLTWGKTTLEFPLPEPLNQSARVSPTPLWLPAITPVAQMPGGRFALVDLNDVEAPYPKLQDRVDESFVALRSHLASTIGWDLLSTLENAFVPLTAPLDPGMGEDWLYTGRAYAITSLPLNAGWMAVVREDFSPYTYWRVYLRMRFQDGSAGVPLHYQPWDFNARYSGDTQAYEQGGALVQAIPAGYWLDFTRLAAGYGWERQPALSTWRSSFPATRFNEFALTDGLDWQSAMLEIYPPEVLITPTIFLPPTRTSTLTPRGYQSPTPTRTLTPRPTLTPISPTPTPLPASPTPTRTATPLRSSTPARTPTPSSTPTLTSTPTNP